MTMKRLLAAALIAILPVAACATGNSNGPSPKRPVVKVADQVGPVDRQMVIGTWACHELNPFPNMPRTVQIVTYQADGKAKNAAVIDTATTAGLPAKFNASFSYDWSVAGEQLVASNVQSSITAADDGAGSTLLAPIAQMMASSFVDQVEPGTSNVLELTKTTLVMSAANMEDPPMISCARS
jgi:hypothetical protein